MLISFPLLSAYRATAETIATSGVSEIDQEQPGSSGTSARQSGPSWRSVATPPSYPRNESGCPECGGRVVRASGCLLCPACGWGRCG